MYKLTFEKHVWVVKQILKGLPHNKIALTQGITDRTVRDLMQRYRQYG